MIQKQTKLTDADKIAASRALLNQIVAKYPPEPGYSIAKGYSTKKVK